MSEKEGEIAPVQDKARSLTEALEKTALNKEALTKERDAAVEDLKRQVGVSEKVISLILFRFLFSSPFYPFFFLS